MRIVILLVSIFIAFSGTGQSTGNYAHVKALEYSSSQWICLQLEQSYPEIFLKEDCPPHFEERQISNTGNFKKLGVPLSSADDKALTELLLREDCKRFLHLKALSDLYFPIFEEKLQANNLPDFYKFLPLCLSGLNPDFNGRNDRNGIWQMTYLEACKYGLNIDKNHDERFIPEFEVNAAVNKLSQLHNIYHEPELVIYAWLKGIPETNNLLESGKRPESSGEINHLFNYYNLIVRTFNIFELGNYAKNYTNLLSEFTKIYKPVNATKAAYSELLHVDPEFLNQSNPWFISENIAGENNTYLLLKNDKADRYKLVKDSLLQWEEIIRKREAESAAITLQEQLARRKEITYTVKKGDALGVIADRHGVSIAELKKWNSLKKDMIFIGQKLLIYSENTSDKNTKEQITSGINEETIYTVKTGDSLWSIAQKFPGVSPEDIMLWNEIDENIRPGQKIKIYKD